MHHLQAAYVWNAGIVLTDSQQPATSIQMNLAMHKK